eukprot:TRINITY_DN11060_c0_g1_i1.p2 TRINITY_DN11060_c0_g1~~TRINITY_DN11060_c0_g1_i1.p2  ORF type:complete len:129 (-),score=25.19 TRINITY_DN11060_c0_g1_i1:129-515(-)
MFDRRPRTRHYGRFGGFLSVVLAGTAYRISLMKGRMNLRTLQRLSEEDSVFLPESVKHIIRAKKLQVIERMGEAADKARELKNEPEIKQLLDKQKEMKKEKQKELELKTYETMAKLKLESDLFKKKMF